MAKRVTMDKWLFAVTMLLVFIGLMMVFSASAVMAKEKMGSAYVFLWRQLAWAAAGTLAMLAAMNIDYKRYRQPAVIFALLGATTLLLLAVLFMPAVNNAHRWIKFGGFTLQPAELAKPALIIFLAWFLATRTRSMDDWRQTLLPAALPALVFAALIVKQPDLGTALACLLIAAVMLYVGGTRLKYFAYAALPALPALYFLIFRVRWRWDRVLAFLNPEADPLGRGFHIIQSQIAVGTGGVTGMGLMEGKQKLFYLPEPHTDFIFAVTAEEFGLLGALLVVSLFGVFLFRSLLVAARTTDVFARYLAVGIATMVVAQALLNISVVLGLMPTKGIPLPFVSYGGSSLFVNLACVGILLNITQQTD